jgi:hypothetical protein
MYRTSRGLVTLCKTLALLSGLLLGSVIAVQGLVLWALNRAPDPPPRRTSCTSSAANGPGEDKPSEIPLWAKFGERPFHVLR